MRKCSSKYCLGQKAGKAIWANNMAGPSPTTTTTKQKQIELACESIFLFLDTCKQIISTHLLNTCIPTFKPALFITVKTSKDLSVHQLVETGERCGIFQRNAVWS